MNTVNLDFSKVVLFATFEGGNLYTINGGLLLTKYVKVDVPQASENDLGYILEEQIVKFASKEDLLNIMLNQGK